jgi:hypothetical protein
MTSWMDDECTILHLRARRKLCDTTEQMTDKWKFYGQSRKLRLQNAGKVTYYMITSLDDFDATLAALCLSCRDEGLESFREDELWETWWSYGRFSIAAYKKALMNFRSDINTDSSAANSHCNDMQTPSDDGPTFTKYSQFTYVHEWCTKRHLKSQPARLVQRTGTYRFWYTRHQTTGCALHLNLDQPEKSKPYIHAI